MKKYKVTNTIDQTTETFNTIKEVKEHIDSELEWFNFYEKRNPYKEDDFIIEEIDNL